MSPRSLLALAAILAAATGCGGDRTSSAPRPAAAGSSIRFQEVTDSGIEFVHDSGATGRWYFPEIMGSGGLFFDYDDDGDLDVYLVQSGPLPPDPEGGPPNRLYEHLEDDRFRDVTDASGAGDRGYGMGACAGDVEGDGDLDLFVTNVGRNSLYLNDGKGRFEEAAAPAGITGGDEDWSSSCAFLDYDGDEDLDLYVAHYVKWTIETDVECRGFNQRDYCSPSAYPAAPDRLYQNDGQGRFRDVTAESGIESVEGKGLGVAVTDINDDGLLDMYVANDGMQNHLFQNKGDGTFEEISFLGGVGFSEQGDPEAGMGVDFGDFDGDLLMDLFVTNLDYETNTLYRNDGNSLFTDVTATVGLYEPSIGNVGFGTAFVDLDLDGDLDIFIVNGHVLIQIEERSHLQFAQKDQVFELVAGRFHDVSGTAGDYFQKETIARGLVVGDYDDDGDLDVLITQNNGPTHLLRNESERRGSWLSVEARSTGPNRFGVGCRVTVRAGERTWIRDIRSGSSYLSQGEMRAHFGLGDVDLVDSVEVWWPGGHTETYRDLAVNQRHRLERP